MALAPFTPAAPALNLWVRGKAPTLSWDSVAGADGYILHYAPYPAASPINSIDLGNLTFFSLPLWQGAAYYVAVQPYNAFGRGKVSNIENFTLP